MTRKAKKDEIPELASLRRKAEKLIMHHEQPEATYANQDLKWLMHELQVQKIELEMQNEELRLSNEHLETERAKFAGIYDLAPVGFFILDLDGIIQEVNQMACALLAAEKKNLIGNNFRNLITRRDTENFIEFLEAIQLYDSRRSCQLTMLKHDGEFFGQVEGIVPVHSMSENIRCYIAVIDITEQRNAKATKEKQILKAILAAQEKDRKRISETLHNSVGQLLYVIRLNLDQQRDQNVSEALNRLLDEAIKETRNISFELAPSILKDFGLRITLEEMAGRLSGKTMDIRVCTNLTTRLDFSLEVDLFRMIQELVNNSIKHGATSITIGLKCNSVVEIEVTDNGSGFKNNKGNEAAGSGLATIRNKLSLYDGEMGIEKSAHGLTVVCLLLRETRS